MADLTTPIVTVPKFPRVTLPINIISNPRPLIENGDIPATTQTFPIPTVTVGTVTVPTLTQPIIPRPITLTQQTVPRPVISVTPTQVTIPRTMIPVTPTRTMIPATPTRTMIPVTPTRTMIPATPTRTMIPATPTQVTVPKTMIPVTPTQSKVPKTMIPVTPTRVTVPQVIPTRVTVPQVIPTQVTKTQATMPRTVIPVTTTIGQQIMPKPVTPIVPKVSKVIQAQVTKTQATTPRTVIPVTTTIGQQIVPKLVTPIVPKVTVTKPVIPVTQAIVPKPVTSKFVQPIIPKTIAPVKLVNVTPLNIKVIGVPRATVTLSPEMIDEDTIIAYANKLNQTNFAGLLKFLGEYYHNDESLVSDEKYDELVDIYEAKYGPYEVVGAEPTGEKIKLPYYLGSLRKLKKDQELTTWLESYKGPYIIEDKIDGLTLLLVSTTELGRRVTRLYTRGGGYRGLDVSHLLGYMRLPQLNADIAIRGEVVMTREAFERVGTEFKNARNLVSGIVNAKKQFNPTLARELSFYAYRIMNKGMTAEEDINELRELGFIVPNPVQSQTLTKEILENYFNMRKKEAPYDMDGLVIYQNKAGDYPEGEAPRHVVAFKTGTETGVTTVINVVWKASKDKLLKPVVHYKTINLSGADLQRASGYNARFIVNNNIGPGAQILLTRSGDVIPKILSVITPAPGGPSLPDPAIHGKYDWNANGVEFVVTDENNDVIAGRLKHFLNSLGVKNAGMKRVEAMVAAGIRSITTLLTISPQQLAGIPGIGPTLSNQFYQDIHERITNASLSRIMNASGIFPNVGERSFEAILEIYPNILDLANLDSHEIANYIRRVKGFDTKADDIGENLYNFASWLRDHPMITIEPPRQLITTPFLVANNPFISQPTQFNIIRPTQVPVQIQGRNLSGMIFAFSGFRDRDLEDRIRKLGGKVTGSVSGNTTMLIMKDLTPQSMKGKAQEAQAIGVKLITREDFISQYL